MRKAFLVILVSTIFIISCDDENMNEDVNPFVGTWEVDNGVRYIFTKTYLTVFKPNGNKSWSGNYTYNDTHITIHTDYRESDFENLEIYPNPFIFTYEFRDIGLIIGMALLIKTNDS